MMVGLLGAWRLATAITTSARRGSDAWDGAVARYEDGQRGASRAVQRTNALIFRNLAVSSRLLGGIRNTALTLLGHVPAIPQRLAAHEAMIGLAP